ncbi:MAG: formylglycine-generating enzyme family protein, partial [Alloprevotella sp.]
RVITVNRQNRSFYIDLEKKPMTNRTFRVGNVEFAMVKVDGGTFTMGATAEMQNPYDDEKPTHQVTLSSYSIGETEVTQALWQAVMGNNPSYFKGDNLPVEQVSWDDCQEFIRKLNLQTGQRFRLPTEAEWEFAARGGNRSNHTQYSGSSNLDEVAWYTSNSGSKTHPVKTKKANELGIYDMTGNVWEWCQDWYGSYSSSSQYNPTGPSSGSYRVYRGGSWNGGPRCCRSSSRCDNAPGYRYNSLGLRLALSE